MNETVKGTGVPANPTEEMEMKEGDNKIRIKLPTRIRTRPSLFHYIRETPEESAFRDIDWSFLTHPVRSFQQWRKEPRTVSSLFHYADEDPKTPFSWKAFLADLFTRAHGPAFVTSVFAHPEGYEEEHARRRTRRMEAGMLSLFIHAAVLGLIMVAVSEAEAPAPVDDNIVYVSNPVYLPYEFEGDGRDGGGGGGGGKNQQEPAATGEMPETTRVQMLAPDPDNPQPLLPAEDLLAQVASVQMPIDLPRDLSLPIGDISAPPNYSRSSGPGSGGGIGTGRGTGVGSGTGAGVGPGSGGGMGGGSGGGIGSGVGPYVAGSGVKDPVAVLQPLPAYTEDARKARIEGAVLIQAIIRKDGTVDNFKVLRGLGHGLDESAIKTIASKWRFRPGTLNGVPVDVQANIEVVFRLY
ncbi:MAG: energy transducer TonB [Acidobacteriota bacterium]|jgi:TonB family protein|nr:energy transducer TonB [Acidobacteriota bacterium]NLT31903.1 energy transducer TonB [Acidobacteriota bacterium]